MSKKKAYFISGIVAVSAFFLGLYYPSIVSYFNPLTATVGLSPLRISNLNGNPYKFIDPLLGVKRPEDSASTIYVSLKTSIDSFINSQIQKNNVETASVYFRDEESGRGFDYNPTEKYSPASLIKVPIMIAYFKLAEERPYVLSEKLLYADGRDLNLEKSISSSINIQNGKTYSISELIDHMIKYSDNNAYTLLVNYLNDTNQYSYVNNLFSDFGIHQVKFDTDYVDINSYSLFFRVLYNATYLSREMSEKALNIMSQTDFTLGLTSGIPKNITVSQKFGEFTTKTSAGEILKRELHNCGIIYYPEHPYLLCVMTKGMDINQLENVISSVSRIVYQFNEKLNTNS